MKIDKFTYVDRITDENTFIKGVDSPFDLDNGDYRLCLVKIIFNMNMSGFIGGFSNFNFPIESWVVRENKGSVVNWYTMQSKLFISNEGFITFVYNDDYEFGTGQKQEFANIISDKEYLSELNRHISPIIREDKLKDIGI